MFNQKRKGENIMESKLKIPSIGLASLVLAIIVLFIAIGMIIFKADIRILIFICWLIVLPFAIKIGYSSKEIANFAYDMIRTSMTPIMIILSVGAMIGSWIASGTVPTFIYAGLKIISPQYFLVTTLLLCSISSLITGTSWGTIGTSGLAMMIIGNSMGIPSGITAGAIVCGAYFGDKMSPISDTTVFAPAVSGGKLLNHIKHMLWTTTPSYIITAILFLIIGFKYSTSNFDYSQINQVSAEMAKSFNLGIIPLIPAVIVIYLLVKNAQPYSSILFGSVVGAIVAILYQGVSVNKALSFLYSGYVSTSGLPFIDTLLTRGGITRTYSTVGLIIFAIGLGGILNGTGIFAAILNSISNKIQSVKTLVISTMLVSYITNILGASSTFSATITGTLMQPLFRSMRMRPENLSRIIEDAGTLGGPIIPWNTASLFPASVLGVSPYAFIPYCFLCYINPIISLIYGITGFTMTELDEGEVYGETDKYILTFKKHKNKVT